MKIRSSFAAAAAAIASLAAAAPAWAQDASTAASTAATTVPAGTDDGGLLWVWVAILVVGVPIIVLGASSGNMGGRR